MVSPSTHLVSAFLRLTAKPKWRTAEGGHRVLAAAKGDPAPPRSLAGRGAPREVNGFVVHTVLPRGGVRAPGAVVYLHGGAYVNEIVKQHWALVADLADATGRAVHVPIYGLAPEHHGLEARDLGLAVLAGLDGDDGPAGAGPVHLVGDSAGGGLALLLAQARRDAGLPPAAGVVVMAPWMDLSMSNPEVDRIEPHDPWLTRAGLRPVAAAWAGDLTLTDPRISPLFGGFAGLPPVDVFVGTRDITLCDSRRLVDGIRAAGGTASLHESVGSPHVHPLLPTREGRRARAHLLARVASDPEQGNKAPGRGVDPKQI